MVSPGTNGEKEPPLPFPSLGSYPAFLRKITRKSHWDNALRDCDHHMASVVFVEDDNSTSVYLVHDDVELRRIAVAMNEYKKSKKEQVNLLAIRPSELKQIGVQPKQTQGAFSCHLAKGLHHDLELDRHAAVALSRVLIEAQREVTRWTSPTITKAREMSTEDGCFSVNPESHSCACGGHR